MRQLGLVSSWAPSPRLRAARASDSRVGGLPRRFGPADAEADRAPTCGACASPLFLVAQVYAPAPGRERNLLVFGCNRGACAAAAAPGSWRVLRSQQPAAEADTTTPAPSLPSPPPPEPPLPRPPAQPVDPPSAEDAWGAAAGAWDSDAAAGAAAINLKLAAATATAHAEALATVRAALEAATAAAAAAATIAGEDGEENEEEAASLRARYPNRFSAFELHTFDDEDADGEEEGCGGVRVGSDESSEDDGVVGGGASGRVSGGGRVERERAHARKVLADYEAWAGTVSVGGGSGSSGGGAAGAGDDFGPVEEGEDYAEGEGEGGNDDDTGGAGAYADTNERHAKDERRAVCVSGGDRRAGVERRRTGHGPGAGAPLTSPAAHGLAGGGSSGERYERLPPRVRLLLRFQRAAARFPEQVLRYEWDGTPLWPAPPPPATSGSCAFCAPRCACGALRRFELQVMPHLLVGLAAEIEARDLDLGPRSGPGAGPNAGSGATGTAGGGMEFLSVLVFCCEASCDESAEEFALVMGEGDMRADFARLRG